MVDTLATLPLQATAAIVSIGGDRAYRRRLMELGFLPGSQLRLVGVAPLGDPLDIELRGCRFSLRRAEAAAIAVTTGALPAEEPADRAHAAK